MTKLPCGIVRDLLPGYIDKLTGKETNTAVEEHLRNCQECAKISDHMREPEPFPAEEDPRQIDYLKKNQKTQPKNFNCRHCRNDIDFCSGSGRPHIPDRRRAGGRRNIYKHKNFLCPRTAGFNRRVGISGIRENSPY